MCMNASETPLKAGKSYVSMCLKIKTKQKTKTIN